MPKVRYHCKTLFIRALVVRVFRINAFFNRNSQPRQRRFLSDLVDIIDQDLPPCCCLQRCESFAMDLVRYPPLGEHREPLIEPELAPIGVCHKVAKPAVSDLMGNHIAEGTVPSKQARCHKGHARVLHAAEWEARRHHHDVISIPFVRAIELLRGQDILLRHVLKLIRGCLHLRGLRPHLRAWPDVLAYKVSHSHGHKVGGNGLRHVETKCDQITIASIAAGNFCGHHSGEALRDTEGTCVGHAHCSRVHAREERPVQTSLALRE
mmetsp:Transcript_119860/g.267638  ORF Transcript_119860/g.267638 Transcript_119860/m.267638 type:complete len:265 (-) Transcript_119860:448-1242(-)